MKNAPCYNCPKRVVGCHSICDAYTAFDRERKAEIALERRLRATRAEADLTAFRKAMKRKKRRSKYV